jgi:hypothetical protein
MLALTEHMSLPYWSPEVVPVAYPVIAGLLILVVSAVGIEPTT